MTKKRNSDSGSGEESGPLGDLLSADNTPGLRRNEPSSRQDGKTGGPQDAQQASRQDGDSDDPLGPLMSALFDQPPALPASPPDLNERSNAYVTAESNRAIGRLQTALQEAYEVKASKSLVTELSLRLALRGAVEQQSESALVQTILRLKQGAA